MVGQSSGRLPGCSVGPMLQGAAAGDAGHHGGQRQRRELQKALADAVHDGVAEIPGLALAQPPGAGRHQAAARPGQLDVERHAEAEPVGHRRHAIHAGAQRHVVEEHVAAVLQRAVQVEFAMAVALPAVEP
jgi:hypothetical protein